MSDDETFEKTDSGASLTFPMQAGSLKKGGFAMLKGFPCKIVEMTTSKAGKHGHANATLVGTDIFTDKKYEDSCPTSHNMEVPNVVRREYLLISIENEYATLMDEKSITREDLKIPQDEIGVGLQKSFDNGDELLITVIGAMGVEKIVSFRVGSF